MLDCEDMLGSFPKVVHCPTFSWASVNTEVLWPHMVSHMRHADNATQLTIVIGGKCDLSTIDPFGRVRDGYVKLFGPVKSGLINHDSISLLRPSDEERFPSEKFPFCADGPFEVVGVKKEWTKKRRAKLRK
jgi:hypothetical protein